ncbi:MAG: Hint domain-containing protein [Halocynthiibacter sp.]
MPTYSVTAYQWAGFTTYNSPFSAVIFDDDAELDWFGGDPGLDETMTFGGTTYTVSGGGTLGVNFLDNDGGGGTVTADFTFVSLVGYGWVFFPPPGVPFTPGDTITGWSTGSWSQTGNVPWTTITCFTAGSRIRTKTGTRPIETVCVGDLIHTHDHGLQSVRWIGRRDLSPQDLLLNPKFRPICFPKGCIRPNTPNRDTLVSPQHRVLFSDWRAELFFGEDAILAPAHALAQVGIAQVVTDDAPVSYIHILFNSHEIVTVDGMESESFHPGPMAIDALDEACRNELFALFPELETDTALYGPSAKPSLKAYETSVFSEFPFA